MCNYKTSYKKRWSDNELTPYECTRASTHGEWCVFHSPDVKKKEVAFKMELKKYFDEESKKPNPTFDFIGWVFPETDFFEGKEFNGEARFSSATFSGDAWFESATFLSDFILKSTVFAQGQQRQIYVNHLKIDGAEFKRSLSITKACLLGIEFKGRYGEELKFVACTCELDDARVESHLKTLNAHIEAISKRMARFGDEDALKKEMDMFVSMFEQLKTSEHVHMSGEDVLANAMDKVVKKMHELKEMAERFKGMKGIDEVIKKLGTAKDLMEEKAKEFKQQ